MQPPSTMLLRAMLKPAAPLCQVRTVTNWMPREKYAAVSRLDKLHRKQKKAIRDERQASFHRAEELARRMQSATTAIPSSSPAPTPASSKTTPAPDPAHPDTSKISTESALLPYRILRTPSQNLPVYETTKAGGSKHITTIRKIQGDIESMRDSIRAVLQLQPTVTDRKGRKKETVAINWATKHIVVRGWRGAEVKKWAEISGF